MFVVTKNIMKRPVSMNGLVIKLVLIGNIFILLKQYVW
jgi:hypothetical protein